MSKQYISDISTQKLTRQKPSEATEALRKGFSEAIKVAVEDHRSAGRTAHEAVVKPRRPR